MTLAGFPTQGGFPTPEAALAGRVRIVPPPRDETAGQPPAGHSPLHALRIMSPAECDTAPSRGYIVKGLIAPGDVVIPFGEPGTGKSVLTPHVAYGVAQGRDVLGRRVRQRRVIYIAAEDGHGMQARIAALYRMHGDAPLFSLVPEPVNLMNAIARLQVEDLMRGEAGLLVVDTIARAFPEMRENDPGPEGMNAAVTVLRGLARNGWAVMAPHHAPKGGDTPRGHGSLVGDVDVTLFLEGAAGEPKRATVKKNRNGPSGTVFKFAVIGFELGTDEDGDPITAPAAEEKEATAANCRDAKKVRLNDATTLLLRTLRALRDDGMETRVMPAPGYPEVLAIRRGTVIDRLLRDRWFHDDEVRDTVPEAGNAQHPITRKAQTRLGKSLDALKAKGFAGFADAWIWLL